MPVQMKINKAAIRRRVLGAWDKGLPALSEEVLKDCNEFAKYDRGGLVASSQDESNSKLDQGMLVWNTHYAARQYYEIQTASHDQNPNARWRWCEAAKRRRKAEWALQAQKGMDENL